MHIAVNIGRDNSLTDRYFEEPVAGDQFIAKISAGCVAIVSPCEHSFDCPHGVYPKAVRIGSSVV
jgi:hypothetical protein